MAGGKLPTNGVVPEHSRSIPGALPAHSRSTPGAQCTLRESTPRSPGALSRGALPDHGSAPPPDSTPLHRRPPGVPRECPGSAPPPPPDPTPPPLPEHSRSIPGAFSRSTLLGHSPGALPEHSPGARRTFRGAYIAPGMRRGCSGNAPGVLRYSVPSAVFPPPRPYLRVSRHVGEKLGPNLNPK